MDITYIATYHNSKHDIQHICRVAAAHNLATTTYKMNSFIIKTDLHPRMSSGFELPSESNEKRAQILQSFKHYKK